MPRCPSPWLVGDTLRFGFWWFPHENLLTAAPLLFFFPDLDSPPPQYTSKSWPLSIPCSIPAKVTWEQIKGLGLRGGHWQFFPRSTSSLRPSSGGQRLFTLSLEERLSWKPDQSRGLTPVSDFKNWNLSLGRKRGEDGDGGNYVCTLTFESGLTLSRTVSVHVLESKSRLISAASDSVVVLIQACMDEWHRSDVYLSYYFTDF